MCKQWIRGHFSSPAHGLGTRLGPYCLALHTHFSVWACSQWSTTLTTESMLIGDTVMSLI